MEVLKIRKDINSPWVEIPAIIGPPGKDYILTDKDKAEIAKIVVALLSSNQAIEQ